MQNSLLTNKKLFSVQKNERSVIFFAQKEPVTITQSIVDELRNIAETETTKNIRLCLHTSPDSLFHEMIIIGRKGRYYPPHRHNNKGESYHILHGMMGVFIFDDHGHVLENALLDQKDAFHFRLGTDMYHMPVALSKMAVFLESIPGPFKGSEDKIFPNWAPGLSHQEPLKVYAEKLIAEYFPNP